MAISFWRPSTRVSHRGGARGRRGRIAADHPIDGYTTLSEPYLGRLQKKITRGAAVRRAWGDHFV